jgi:hypothetical protein
MLIEKTIKSVIYAADNWVRFEKARRVPKGLEVSFGIHKGQRGKRVDAWKITCQEIHEARITAQDMGGMAMYPSGHPAARQFTARQASIRWSGNCDEIKVIGALYKAHTAVVDDWIPFDYYSSILATSKGEFTLRGPAFLMQAYVKVLRAMGEKPRLMLRRGKRKSPKPKVLHFGDSYIVANKFLVERVTDKQHNPSGTR